MLEFLEYLRGHHGPSAFRPTRYDRLERNSAWTHKVLDVGGSADGDEEVHYEN